MKSVLEKLLLRFIASQLEHMLTDSKTPVNPFRRNFIHLKKTLQPTTQKNTPPKKKERKKKKTTKNPHTNNKEAK